MLPLVPHRHNQRLLTVCYANRGTNGIIGDNIQTFREYKYVGVANVDTSAASALLLVQHQTWRRSKELAVLGIIKG